MNMRVTGSYPAGLTSSVDKRIGDAFPIVDEVYKHLKELTYLANHADKLTARQIQLRSNLENKSIEWSYAGNEWLLLCTFDELVQVDGIRNIENTIIGYIDDAVNSASAASASAATATTKANEAKASALAAAVDATTASTKAGEASSSAASALASSDNANIKYKLFDKRYLGAKTTDPTTDNFGQPLLVGAEYWNSTANVRKVWSGTRWTSENVADLGALTAALDTKAPINNPTFTGTVSGVTKAMVGLRDVDNTSDLAKPISSATQAALDGKAAATHTHDASDITSGTLSDERLPAIQISKVTGLQASLNSKQDTLISGTNLKTINGESILGSGNLVVDLGLGVADPLAYYILAKS